MMKYPIGVQSFEQIIEDGYVYVDKTALIYDLVTRGKIYFLSRPRRFGKSLLMSTIENYFLGRKELFTGLAMEGLENEWLEYPVFHIDFNAGNFKKAGALEEKINAYLHDWEDVYGQPEIKMGAGDRFARILHLAYVKTGRRCVVLIDEYDKPLLDVLETGLTTVVDGQERLLEEWHRDVLRGLYSVFKAADADLQFVLLTGVTKFSQVSVFSEYGQPVRRAVRDNAGGAGKLFCRADQGIGGKRRSQCAADYRKSQAPLRRIPFQRGYDGCLQPFQSAERIRLSEDEGLLDDYGHIGLSGAPALPQR